MRPPWRLSQCDQFLTQPASAIVGHLNDSAGSHRLCSPVPRRLCPIWLLPLAIHGEGQRPFCPVRDRRAACRQSRSSSSGSMRQSERTSAPSERTLRRSALRRSGAVTMGAPGGL